MGFYDNLEEWIEGDGGRLKKEGTYIYLRLIQVIVWQKPTQHCKAIILQLKIKKRMDFLYVFFFNLFIFLIYFIFKLYIIVLVLPNIKMNPPQGNTYICVLYYLILALQDATPKLATLALPGSLLEIQYFRSRSGPRWQTLPFSKVITPSASYAHCLALCIRLRL